MFRKSSYPKAPGMSDSAANDNQAFLGNKRKINSYKKVMDKVALQSQYDAQRWYSSSHTAKNIYQFILETFNALNIDASQDIALKFFLPELISNNYDSYIDIAESTSKPLTITTVIKERDDRVVIKIADNGKGFDKGKNIYFFRDEINEEPKDRDFYIGGVGRGLINLEQSLAESQAYLFFKNRKSSGANVYLSYPNPRFK